ncbi:MAG TPA: hypothetical protein PLE49_02705 [Mycobacterium sp.]|uniref:hypothetical protein n=1 Tax=Mycolicibacterium sp. TaxID=2320850 RepID=UPI0025EBDF56|nr:hypothetical protein [Mycolicibacterium sp.]HPX35597.1 hypothetical protein [Mycobacterium sp.]
MAPPVARSVAPAFAPLQTISVAVDRFLTGTANWLAGFPANPVTDLLQGALYLVRRALFPTSVGVITQPVEVPLYFADISSDGVQKIGIYASLGGNATPQFFEFDTGGGGFFAPYASADPAFSPWWGSAVQTSSTVVHNEYDSGLTYSGYAATTTVSLFAAPGSSTPLLTTGRLGVGQIDTIQKLNQSGEVEQTYWGPDGATTPPVDGAFWGDFGVAPSYSTAGIEDLIAQLTYGCGVLPGYRIHVDPETQTAWMRVGLTSADVQDPTALYFPMLPDTAAPSGATFANSGALYYGSPAGEQLFTSTINIWRGTTPVVTDVGVGITPDTGASTTLHNTDKSPTPEDYTGIITWTNADQTVGQLDKDKDLTFFLSTMTSGTPVEYFQFPVTNEVDYGQVDVQNNRPTRPTYYLNTGISLFFRNDVVYSLGDSAGGGILGLIPRA